MLHHLPPPSPQALRSRLPPAADGRSGGKTAQQQLAALVLVPLPLLLVAALLAQQRVWQQWLGAAVGSAGSRVYRVAGAAGIRVRGLTPSRSRGAINGGSGSGSGSSSPQTSCRGNLQHLLLGEPPAAGAAAAAATPAWLPAAAGVAGMGSVLLALMWTVSIIPRQVGALWSAREDRTRKARAWAWAEASFSAPHVLLSS
jgi:hypothetical protein